MASAVVGFLTKTFIGKMLVSYALNVITNKLFGTKTKSTSPTYSFGTLQTQTNSGMAMPLIYGKVKCAGNNIWASPAGTVQYHIISYGVGKIKSFSDVRINDIPIGSLPGCSYTAYLGDGEQLIDWRVTGATQEDKAKLVGGMKYDAYLAITATASDKLSSVNTVTAVVDGRIVRVYTTPTIYTEQWSDNPAWCELDFKTSIDGCGMDISSIDIQTYLTAANYYDQLVGTTKRFTLNLILDEKKTRQDWLTEIFSTCRSYPTYQRGLHGILVDKPELVSQIFTVKSDESIETWWQDNAEDIERLQIEYVDPDYEYTKVLAQADRVQLTGETSQFRNKIPLTKKISIYGINNFKQASREAWFHLNKAQTCPEWIQYTTNKRALNRSIGDVVGVWNPITEVVEEGLPYKRYRIMTMTEPQENKITMVMQEYNHNLYTDQQASVAPTINVTNLTDQYGAPSDPVAFYSFQNLRQVKHNWSILSDNIAGVEIRQLNPTNPVWESGQVITSKATGTKFIDNGISVGLLVYGIKTISNKGVYSDGMKTSSFYVTAVPASNIIVAFDEFQALNGTVSGCSVEGAIIALDVAEQWDELTTELWDELTTDLWGSPSVDSGTYTTAIKDMGKSLTSLVQIQEIACSGPYSLEWKYSATDATLDSTEWQIFIDGTSATFQYHQWRLTMTGGSSGNSCTALKIGVDVPDVILKYPNETVTTLEIIDASAGIRIDFPQPFVKIPTVTGSVVGTVGYIFPDVITTTYCILIATTNGIDRKTASIQAQIIGY